jgi:glycosyltransferase involved in cell wall biosynthesis
MSPSPWPELAGRSCIVVPAYDAEPSIRAVLEDLRGALPEVATHLVVDDGSADRTAEIASEAGARVVRHGRNRGKGAALQSGLLAALEAGYDIALAVDADGQHPAESAREVLYATGDPHALVLGVRNLLGEGAPRANRMSNAISNFFLSRFAGLTLHDTQCGLRRYPVKETLALGARAEGYAFEAEVLLRASFAGIPILQREIHVIYPPEHQRVTHFDSVRDPMRIIAVVLATVRDARGRGK